MPLQVSESRPCPGWLNAMLNKLPASRGLSFVLRSRE